MNTERTRWRRQGGAARVAVGVALAVLVLLALATGGRAEDRTSEPLNLWPVYDEREDPLERAHVRSGVGPLLMSSHSTEGEVSEFAFRPFFFWREEQASQRLEWDFLYPFVTYRRTEGDWEIKFLEVLNARGEGVPQAGREERADFFPFYFSGVRENGERYRAIMPFWGKAYDRIFQEEIEFVAFPLYARMVRGGATTTYFPWPFLSVTRGENQSGFRFIPLYGEETKQGVFEKRFVLWPLYLHQKTGLDGDDPEDVLAILPFYVSDRSRAVDSTTVLWPFFTYTEQRERHYEQLDAPWPFFMTAWGEGRKAFKLFPLYMDDRKFLRNAYLMREINYRDRFVLFPLYARSEEEIIGNRKVRDRILWYLYSDSRSEGTDGSSRRIDAWPLVRYERDREGAVVFQTLALLEAFMPGNEWIERSYSPLWALYTYRASAEGESVHSFLWNLLRHEETKAGRAIEVLGPLLAYREAGERAHFSLLGGLVRYDVQGDVRSLRLGGANAVTWVATPQPVANLASAGGIR